MNCYDCETQATTITAVAVCHDCGAGVCAHHASVSEHHLTVTRALNMRIPTDPPQRRVRCLVCADAVTATNAKKYK